MANELHEFADWPKDLGSGRLLCAPGKPRPAGAKGLWAHTRVETICTESDFRLGHEYDRKRCKDCHLEWTEEIAQ